MNPSLRAVALRLDQGRQAEAAAELEGWWHTLPRPQQVDASTLVHVGPLALRCGLPGLARDAFEAQRARGPVGPDLLVNLGVAHRRCGDPTRALQCHDLALALDGRHAAAHNNRSLVLAELGRPAEALAALQQALACGIDGLPQRLRQAQLLQALGRLDQAMAVLDQAIARYPRSPDLHGQRGKGFTALGHGSQARDAFALAVAADGGAGPWLSALVQARQAVADWTGWPAEIEGLQEQARAGKALAAVLPLWVTQDDPALQLAAMRAWAASQAPARAPSLCAAAADRLGRVRIGFFSADLHDHPVGHLLAAVLERIDRRRFVVTAFALGPTRDDAWRRRIEAAVDGFVAAGPLSDGDLVAQARARELDIAIDLNGPTAGARPGLFAARLAPLQVAWLGWLGTTGSESIDYLVADAHLMPPGTEGEASEKLLHLPVYQPNEPWQPPPPAADRRADWGLPAEGFVLASFNSPYKITPPVFDAWMTILRACHDAVLWLHVDGQVSTQSLRAAALAAGVTPERIVFAPPCPLAQHLQRQRHADLHLDTWPYNGGATTSNALRAGLPVLSLAGRSFCSRMGASLLHAVGLPELATGTLEAYVATAVGLAGTPTAMKALKARLNAALPTTPLFDADGFTRHFEAALLHVHERRCRGLAPALLPWPLPATACQSSS